MLGNNLRDLCLRIYTDDLSGLELGERDQFVVGVAVANIGCQLQMDGVAALGLLQGQHANVQVQITEENHVVHHEAEERSQFVFGRQHELLGLVFDDGCYLLLDLAGLLLHEVHPREFFFHTVIELRVLRCIRVRVEDME